MFVFVWMVNNKYRACCESIYIVLQLNYTFYQYLYWGRRQDGKVLIYLIFAWKPYIFRGNKMRSNNDWGPRHCPNTFCNNSILTSLIVKPFEPITSIITQKCNEKYWKQACSLFILLYSFLMVIFLTVKTISYNTCKCRPTC